jgi:hypothetical protein
MSLVISIPDGLTTCKLSDGREFRISFIEAMTAYEQILEECRKNPSNDFAHTKKFADWLKDKTGVELTPDQADYLIDRINCEYANAKKEVRALLNSVSSMEPPSGSSTTKPV